MAGCRKGFSLVEITVVLVILGLAAGTVALNYRGPLRDLGLRDLAHQVVSFDRLTRVQAREQDRSLRLVFDLGANEVRRVETDGLTERGERLVPSGDYRLEKVRVGQVESTTGCTVVPCGRLGLTPSYAVSLRGPGGQQRWLVVSGLTGLVEELDDGKELAEIFASPPEAGNDAR